MFFSVSKLYIQLNKGDFGYQIYGFLQQDLDLLALRDEDQELLVVYVNCSQESGVKQQFRGIEVRNIVHA